MARNGAAVVVCGYLTHGGEHLHYLFLTIIILDREISFQISTHWAIPFLSEVLLRDSVWTARYAVCSVLEVYRPREDGGSYFPHSSPSTLPTWAMAPLRAVSQERVDHDDASPE